MPYRYSARSRLYLSTCHPEIEQVFLEAIKYCDVTILCGARDEEAQNEMVRTGRSQLIYPRSWHNKTPSQAIDAAPYPIDWKDRERFTMFAGFILGLAKALGIHLRWGGDWDMDFQVRDNRFDDLVHFERRQ